jgi:hypothetical protein
MAASSFPFILIIIAENTADYKPKCPEKYLFGAAGAKTKIKTIVQRGKACYNICQYRKWEELCLYKVADIVFEAEACGGLFETRAGKYRAGSGAPEFTVTVSQEESDWLMGQTRLSDDGARYLISGNKFYFKLIERGGLLLHSSAVVKGGRAFLFSGNSGVGKSTHTCFWLRLFEDAYVLNDDKPALRAFEDGFKVYGTPWSGKHDISRNESVALGGIAFLERAEENFIELMPAAEAAKNILAQTVRCIERESMERLLSTMDRLVRETPIFRLGCTPDISAAELSSSIMLAEV